MREEARARPPGWYRCEHGEWKRWWDGTRWTDHRQPVVSWVELASVDLSDIFPGPESSDAISAEGEHRSNDIGWTKPPRSDGLVSRFVSAYDSEISWAWPARVGWWTVGLPAAFTSYAVGNRSVAARVTGSVGALATAGLYIVLTGWGIGFLGSHQPVTHLEASAPVTTPDSSAASGDEDSSTRNPSASDDGLLAIPEVIPEVTAQEVGDGRSGQTPQLTTPTLTQGESNGLSTTTAANDNSVSTLNLSTTTSVVGDIPPLADGPQNVSTTVGPPTITPVASVTGSVTTTPSSTTLPSSASTAASTTTPAPTTAPLLTTPTDLPVYDGGGGRGRPRFPLTLPPPFRPRPGVSTTLPCHVDYTPCVRVPEGIMVTCDEIDMVLTLLDPANDPLSLDPDGDGVACD